MIFLFWHPSSRGLKMSSNIFPAPDGMWQNYFHNRMQIFIASVSITHMSSVHNEWNGTIEHHTFQTPNIISLCSLSIEQSSTTHFSKELFFLTLTSQFLFSTEKNTRLSYNQTVFHCDTRCQAHLNSCYAITWRPIYMYIYMPKWNMTNFIVNMSTF